MHSSRETSSAPVGPPATESPGLLSEERLALYEQMYAFLKELFPITRSITGEGVRVTLRRIKDRLPGLEICEVPSGTPAFDWKVPPEWNVREAHITDPSGNCVVDFADHNLSVVGYAAPVDQVISLEELQKHLHSIPEQPEAIPFRTSFYERRWGFCLPHEVRTALDPGDYHVYIDSSLESGALTYGELVLPGASDEEVLLSTYVCHPSLANDNLSGPVLATFLGEWLQRQTGRRYTYRILFIPETIGSIVYLSRHLDGLRKRVAAGFVLTCVGDERTFSFLPSRSGQTLADRVATRVLSEQVGSFERYSFLDRGSDERQYCSPGVDLPVVSIMRSKYGEYPEYHTSNDDLSLVSAKGLGGSYEVYRRCIELLESNRIYATAHPCEPQLSQRGLYPTLGAKQKSEAIRDLLNVYMYADGTRDVVAIAERLDLSTSRCLQVLDTLREHGLIAEVPTE